MRAGPQRPAYSGDRTPTVGPDLIRANSEEPARSDWPFHRDKPGVTTSPFNAVANASGRPAASAAAPYSFAPSAVSTVSASRSTSSRQPRLTPTLSGSMRRWWKV